MFSFSYRLFFTGRVEGDKFLVEFDGRKVLLTQAPFELLLQLAVSRLKAAPGTVGMVPAPRRKQDRHAFQTTVFRLRKALQDDGSVICRNLTCYWLNIDPADIGGGEGLGNFVPYILPPDLVGPLLDATTSRRDGVRAG